MTSKRRPYNQYSREYKNEALRQLEASSRPATELAAEIEIRPNWLGGWESVDMVRQYAHLGITHLADYSENGIKVYRKGTKLAHRRNKKGLT